MLMIISEDVDMMIMMMIFLLNYLYAIQPAT